MAETAHIADIRTWNMEHVATLDITPSLAQPVRLVRMMTRLFLSSRTAVKLLTITATFATAIGDLHEIIKGVTIRLGEFGPIMNRFEYAVDNLHSISHNRPLSSHDPRKPIRIPSSTVESMS
jgi:hypothetical protein